LVHSRTVSLRGSADFIQTAWRAGGAGFAV